MSCTWRVEAPGQTVFVKLVSSASRPPVTPGRWEARLKQSLGLSVALHTHHVTQRMIERGLHVPEVLLAVRRRHGWHRDDLLATRAVTGFSLVEALTDGSCRQVVHETFRMVGRRIADLHRAGFVHGHLLPGHVFITPDRTDVCFLDNDETRWRPGGVRDADRRYNLTQLVARLRGAYLPGAAGAVRCLIEAYCDAIGVAERQRRRWHYRILTRARHRSQKRRGQRVHRVAATGA